MFFFLKKIAEQHLLTFIHSFLHIQNVYSFFAPPAASIRLIMQSKRKIWTALNGSGHLRFSSMFLIVFRSVII